MRKLFWVNVLNSFVTGTSLVVQVLANAPPLNLAFASFCAAFALGVTVLIYRLDREAP